MGNSQSRRVGKTRDDWRRLLTQQSFRNIVLPSDLIAIVPIGLSAGLLQAKSRGNGSSKPARVTLTKRTN